MDMKLNIPLIRSERERRAWTQQQLADVAGLSLRTVQRIEATGNGGAESVKAIAAAFDLDLATLLLVTNGRVSEPAAKPVIGQWRWASVVALSLVAAVTGTYMVLHTTDVIGEAAYYRFEGAVRIDDGDPHEFGIDVKSDQVFILEIDRRQRLLLEAPEMHAAESVTRIRLLQNDGLMYNVLHSSTRPAQSGTPHSVAYRVCGIKTHFYAPMVERIPDCDESFTNTSR